MVDPRRGLSRLALTLALTLTPTKAGQTEGVSDTAYSNAGIRPHTDGTYFRDPPGLQARYLVITPRGEMCSTRAEVCPA